MSELGTSLPNVTIIRTVIGDPIATPGGVYVWPGGAMVTAYTDPAGGVNGGIMVPAANINRMFFGKC